MVYDIVVMVMCNLCHSHVQVCVCICIFLCVISIPTEKKGLVVMISKRLLGLVK